MTREEDDRDRGPTTIYLPDDLKIELRIQAMKERRTMSAILEELARQYLAQCSSTQMQPKSTQLQLFPQLSSKQLMMPMPSPTPRRGDTDSEDADKIKLLIELHGQGLSLRAIAEEMKSRGIPTLKDKVEWNRGLVHRALIKAGVIRERIREK